jgi:Ran GTPase-activating protein (RanGAP) involved in mRNA processing and transport
MQLAASPHLNRLRRLNVRHNNVSARGVATLIDATTLPALEALDLAETKTYFVRRGSQFLGSPGLRRIRSLDLGLTGLGDEGLLVLSDCIHLSELRSLAVPNTTLTHRGIRALTSSLYLTELEQLDLSGNYFGPESAELLAEWPAAGRLRKLWLHNNALGDEGVRALARSPHLHGLQFLSVGSSSISDRARAALRDRFGERVRYDAVCSEGPR